MAAFFQYAQQIAAAMRNPLDANRVGAYPEENHVFAHNRQPRIAGNLRPEPIELRLPGDLLHPCAESAQKPDRVPRAVLGDVLGDLFQVSRHKRRQEESHYRPAA